MGALGFMLSIFIPETYAPVVLIGKASRLRKETGNWAIHAELEQVEVNFQALVTKYFTRPLRMLFTEPLLFLISFYISFIYGLLYLSVCTDSTFAWAAFCHSLALIGK